MSEDDGGRGKDPKLNPDLDGDGSSVKIRVDGAESTAESDLDSPPPFSDQVLENVLESVVQFLTARCDRSSASLVSKSWYRAEAHTRRELFIGNCYAVSPRRAVERFPRVRSVVLKGKPRFADFNLVPDNWGAHLSPWLAAMSPAYPWMERLCLKRMAVTDDDLSLLAGSFPSFRDLSLSFCDGFTTTGLAAVAEKCRNLRVLDLIENYLEEDEDEAVDWISRFPESETCLESLVFDCVGCAVNFEALEALVARSPALRRLQLNHHISVSQLQRLMSRAPQLTHLGTGSFSYANPPAPQDDDVDLAPVFAAAAKSLVCLAGFRDVGSNYLPAIYPVCANLTTLNFSFAELSADELKPVIRRCQNLRIFWVLDSVGDEGLLAVAATCKNLEELRVFPLDPTEGSVVSVSDIGLMAISNGCPKLRSILYFCQRMTNFAVVTMSKNCPDLVVFRLCIMGRRLPDRLTGEPMDEGFGAIVMNCNKLTRLAVSGLLTDKAFEYIGRYGKLVRTLSVAFAGDSDSGLRYVLEGCPRLKKLEIRDSPFGDWSLLSGIHQYYNMRFLWMSSCKLSLSGCNIVAQKLPHLVVEVIMDGLEDNDNEYVEKLYMYRSLAGPRDDVPSFVKILQS